MKTVGYVRVSTDKQAERGISLEAQAEKIRAMALVQGAELSEIIVESGESAKSLNRHREGPVRVAGTLREARRGVRIGGRVARHRLRRREAGAEHHGGEREEFAGLYIASRSPFIFTLPDFAYARGKPQERERCAS
jgi:resolvase-like protein